MGKRTMDIFCVHACLHIPLTASARLVEAPREPMCSVISEQVFFLTLPSDSGA